MATFIYKAKKGNSETVTGQLSAQTQDEAVELIHQLGLLPVAVEEQADDEIDIKKLTSGKVKSKELYVFSRQLANLLKSGVSLLQSLTIIEHQTKNRYFRHVIDNISVGIKNGKSLSECLADYPNIFSHLYITMVHAGEESSHLQEMLINVALYQKKQEELFSKIKRALAYPIFMLFVGAGTVYFILSFVLPRMSGLFSDLGDQLPAPTVVLLAISEVLNNGGVWTFIIICILALVIKRWFQTAKGMVVISRLMLRMPLVGDVLLKAELSRFCRALVLLLNSGVSIIKALDVAIPMLDNEIVKEHLLKCKESLTYGGSFGASLQESPHIPDIMGHLISVGEESGHLVDVLNEISENYEQETDEKIKTLTTLIEPILILSVGSVIAFIVIAMLLPIFQIDLLSQ